MGLLPGLTSGQRWALGKPGLPLNSSTGDTNKAAFQPRLQAAVSTAISTLVLNCASREGRGKAVEQHNEMAGEPG